MNPNGARVVAVCLTDAGEALVRRLPYRGLRVGQEPDRQAQQRAQGKRGLAKTVAALWAEVDGLVLVGAVGIAVRVIGPHLSDKRRDPAVVCVDDGGRWAVALAGGHRGANDLAREVAGLVGAEPVITTASDGADGVVPLDSLPGFVAQGDVAGVTRAWLDGTPPTVDRRDLPDWPLPECFWRRVSVPDDRYAPPEASRGTRVRVTDRAIDPSAGEVVLLPPSLVLGVGSSSGADPDGIARLVEDALAQAGLSPHAVGLVATVDRKADEPGIMALAGRLNVPLRCFPAQTLAELPVPTPSPVVAAAVGTPSVAEAAALAAAGPDGVLVVTKQRSTEATVAVARRRRSEGHLTVVGLGPGQPAWRTPAAATAIRRAEVVVGYGPYLDLAADLLGTHHELVRSPIGEETERCAEALSRAAAGAQVALVCSGDPGVYAMASLVCELAPAHGNPLVTVEPGVTAALAAAALLGAPLGHDHVSLSLSDLLTPWDVIERRLLAAAESDLVCSLYNPRSQRRTWQLERALEILAEHRPADCPAAVATDVGRPGQRLVQTTLSELDPATVDMLSLVLVGASTTRWVGGRMVTPRGYTVDGRAGAAG